MTDSPNTADIVERLCEREYHNGGGSDDWPELVNPDGPEAAAIIEELCEALVEITPLLETERAVIFDSNVHLSGKYKGQVIDALAKQEIAAMDAAITKARSTLAKVTKP